MWVGKQLKHMPFVYIKGLAGRQISAAIESNRRDKYRTAYSCSLGIVQKTLKWHSACDYFVHLWFFCPICCLLWPPCYFIFRRYKDSHLTSLASCCAHTYGDHCYWHHLKCCHSDIPWSPVGRWFFPEPHWWMLAALFFPSVVSFSYYSFFLFWTAVWSLESNCKQVGFCPFNWPVLHCRTPFCDSKVVTFLAIFNTGSTSSNWISKNFLWVKNLLTFSIKQICKNVLHGKRCQLLWKILQRKGAITDGIV